jgi:Ca2+-binding RTX toxin-like protein
MASKAFLQQAYLAYFGRPADVSGLAFYADQSEAQVKAAFSASPESQAFFGSMAVANQINTIYRNLFNRDAEPAGLTYWSQEIGSGRLSLADAAMGILAGAQNDDKVAVTNKLAASAAFTTALDTTAEILGYAGSAAVTPARAFLAAVDATAASLTAATAGVAAAVVSVTTAGSAVAGQTFMLTAGVDASGSLVGSAGTTSTAGPDTFNSADTTLTVIDNINGGDGVDTLNYTNSAAAALPAALISVEVLNVRAVAALTAGDLQQVTGLTTFNADRSTAAVTVTNLAANGVFGIIGNGNVVNGAANLGSVATATAQTLNFSGGTLGTPATVLTGTGVLATTINSSGAANVTGTITAAATATALTLNATSALTTGAITAAGVTGATSSLTIAGTANVLTDVAAVAAPLLTISNTSGVVTTGTLNNATVTVNASANTGGVVTTLGISTAMAFTGGAGNDIVTAGAILGATAAVNGGAGTDTLVFTNANQLTLVSGARYTNFEVVQSTGATGLDMDLIAGITALRTSGNATFTNVSATQAANITTIASGALNIGVKNAATAGQLDTVSITTSSVANTAVAIATLAAAGVETINLTSGTGTGLTSITTLAHADWTTLNLAGASPITVTTTATAASVNTVINGSAATGVLTISAALSTTNGVAITGGAGNDVLTGSGQADVISGGAGADVITGGVGADIHTGGAGADTFVFAAGSSGGADNAAVADVITDFVIGTDKLQFGNVDVVSAQQAAVQTAVTALAATSTDAQVATAMALANTTANGVAFAVFGGNTYVFVEPTNAGDFVVANNIFIKLTGVTTLPTFAADVIA